ncbi:hypothetical protein V501_09176, partial [Pseudogymnoascus sp. VKM F-4519 (FW-2642)]
MFNTVKKWVDENPHRSNLNHVLGSASVKSGGNHKGGNPAVHSHGPDNSHSGFGGYGQAASAVWGKIQARDLGAMREIDDVPSRGISPSPSTPVGAFGYSSAPGGAPSYGGGGGGGEPYLGAQSGPSGYSYDNAAPASSYQASSGGGYQAQEPYQGGGYGGGYGSAPPQQSYGGPGGPGGYPPQQSGGWQQGPPPPQQGGWQQGPPQQQGGWQQGPPPPQQGGWQQGPPQGPPQQQGGYP